MSKSGLFIAFFLVFPLLATPLAITAQTSSQITIHDVKVYPNLITVRDQQINVVANISSSLSLKSVVLYAGVTNSSIVPQNINYTRHYMYQSNIVNGSQYWEGQLPPQAHPTFFVFYVNATDVSNQSAFYPSVTSPWVLPVENIPTATLNPASFQIDSLTFGLDYSYANLTVQLQAQMYSSSSYIPVFSRSLPHGYGIEDNLNLVEDQNYRFSYSGKSTFQTELSGLTYNYPYDSYLLGVNMSIPYPDMNYTPSPQVQIYPSNQIASSFDDSWKITTIQQGVSYHGNDTFLSYEFLIQRSNQPLSFPMIGIADVILLASALVFAAASVEKRLTVYLTSVVISVSVLISQSLNPFGFGITIFEYFFSYLMLANAILIASAIFAWRAGAHTRLASLIDVGVGAIVAYIGYNLFGNSPMPQWIWMTTLLIPLFAVAFRLLDNVKRSRAFLAKCIRFFIESN